MKFMSTGRIPWIDSSAEEGTRHGRKHNVVTYDAHTYNDFEGMHDGRALPE